MRLLLVSVATLIGSLGTPFVVHPTAATPAVIRLACEAAPSVARPLPNTVTTVKISQVADGKVAVAAHFRSGTVVKVVQGSAAGTAAASFNVGAADRGRRVPVIIAAARGNLQWTCSTSFIPR